MRLRHVAEINPPTPEFDDFSPDEIVPFVPLEAVWSRGLDLSRNRPRREVATGYTRFRNGDIVVPKITPTFQADRTTIAHGISGGVAAGTTELHVVRPTSRADSRYLRHLLGSRPFLLGGVAEMIGVAGQRRVPDDWLRDFPVPITDVRQQRAIADFLDNETARIDTLIAKKRRLRSLTIERARSDISLTVSKGEPLPVRRVICLRTSGPRGWADLVGDDGSPFVRSQNLRRDGIELDLSNVARVDAPRTPESSRSQTRTGDVLVGITGANTGWVGLVRQDAGGGYVSQHVAVLRPEGCLPDWLAYSLFAHQAQDQLLGGQYGGTKTQLGLDELANLTICVPSTQEQSVALNRLERRLAAARRAQDALNRQVDLLREHRQTMITAAVTGELEIPGVAA